MTERATEPLVLAVLLLAATGYLTTAAATSRRRSTWPRHRAWTWMLGLLCVGVALVGPLAAAADDSFTAHMASHLLLGMLGPLLLVLGCPVTLALRGLPQRSGRRLVAVLRSGPVRVLTHPVVAAVLDAGGLWVIYTAGIYEHAQRDETVHMVVHLHVLATGYLFSNAIIGTEPTPHRMSRPGRAVVLVLASAAHGMLAKHLYASPPLGVATGQAEAGAMLMYYGGDAVTLALTVVFCYWWYGARAVTADVPQSFSTGA